MLLFPENPKMLTITFFLITDHDLFFFFFFFFLFFCFEISAGGGGGGVHKKTNEVLKLRALLIHEELYLAAILVGFSIYDCVSYKRQPLFTKFP